VRTMFKYLPDLLYHTVGSTGTPPALVCRRKMRRSKHVGRAWKGVRRGKQKSIVYVTSLGLGLDCGNARKVERELRYHLGTTAVMFFSLTEAVSMTVGQCPNGFPQAASALQRVPPTGWFVGVARRLRASSPLTRRLLRTAWVSVPQHRDFPYQVTCGGVARRTRSSYGTKPVFCHHEISVSAALSSLVAACLGSLGDSIASARATESVSAMFGSREMGINSPFMCTSPSASIRRLTA